MNITNEYNKIKETIEMLNTEADCLEDELAAIGFKAMAYGRQLTASEERKFDSIESVYKNITNCIYDLESALSYIEDYAD